MERSYLNIILNDKLLSAQIICYSNKMRAFVFKSKKDLYFVSVSHVTDLL